MKEKINKIIDMMSYGLEWILLILSIVMIFKGEFGVSLLLLVICDISEIKRKVSYLCYKERGE